MSSPFSVFPSPATKPEVFNNEEVALKFVTESESESAAPNKDNKSGLLLFGNLVKAIGLSPSLSPE